MHMKTLGLAAVAVAALMALAGTASATTGTKAGEVSLSVGSTVELESVGNTIIDGTVNVKCTGSFLHAKVTNAGSATATVGLSFESIFFNVCHSATVAVLEKGTAEIHTDIAGVDNGNGTVTSSGLRFTILTHNILGTVHCLYETLETDLGTLDGSNTTGGGATLTVDSVPIERVSTDFGCGNTSELTAEYTVSTPVYLYIH